MYVCMSVSDEDHFTFGMKVRRLFDQTNGPNNKTQLMSELLLGHILVSKYRNFLIGWRY